MTDSKNSPQESDASVSAEDISAIVKLFQSCLAPIEILAKGTVPNAVHDYPVSRAVGDLLAARVFIGFNHSMHLAGIDAENSSATVGSIVRNMFEAAVNFLYVFGVPETT